MSLTREILDDLKRLDPQCEQYFVTTSKTQNDNVRDNVNNGRFKGEEKRMSPGGFNEEVTEYVKRKNGSIVYKGFHCVFTITVDGVDCIRKIGDQGQENKTHYWIENVKNIE